MDTHNLGPVYPLSKNQTLSDTSAEEVLAIIMKTWEIAQIEHNFPLAECFQLYSKKFLYSCPLVLSFILLSSGVIKVVKGFSVINNVKVKRIDDAYTE